MAPSDNQYHVLEASVESWTLQQGDLRLACRLLGNTTAFLDQYLPLPNINSQYHR